MLEQAEGPVVYGWLNLPYYYLRTPVTNLSYESIHQPSTFPMLKQSVRKQSQGLALTTRI